jgi:hypothetical protein
MLHSLCVLAALAAPTADDDLGKVISTVTGADGYAFTVRETPRAEVEGRYQKDRPAFFKADRIDFLKKGDVLLYKRDDKWQQSKTGIQSDPLIVLGASAKVRGARLPHEELALLQKHLRDVKKVEEKGQTIYRGDLAEEGARLLAKTEDRDVARRGTVRLWVDDKGRLERYEIVIRLRGKRGNAEVDGESSRTVTLKDIGATKVDVPDEAKKLLE